MALICGVCGQRLGVILLNILTLVMASWWNEGGCLAKTVISLAVAGATGLSLYMGYRKVWLTRPPPPTHTHRGKHES